jgi:endonuclease/exonuclease/phosphatase family metal-dependent hydrolase
VTTLFLLLVISSSNWGVIPTQSIELLEEGQASKLIKPNQANGEFPVVSYNIRWRTGDQLNQIGEWLKKKGPAIVALQEVDRAKKRTSKANNARTLAETLGMYYAWAAPPVAKGVREEETGVELLSPYPLSAVVRIVLPNEGPGGRSRVALGATIEINEKKIRVYSVHSENRMAELKKIDQFKAVLTDLERFGKEMPAIVMGDFNTWEPAMVDRTRELFTSEGFTTPFADGHATFRRSVVFYNLELKLDWIWLRGLTAKDFGIDRTFTVSDHFPLWTLVSMPSKSAR